MRYLLLISFLLLTSCTTTKQAEMRDLYGDDVCARGFFDGFVLYSSDVCFSKSDGHSMASVIIRGSDIDLVDASSFSLSVRHEDGTVFYSGGLEGMFTPDYTTDMWYDIAVVSMSEPFKPGKYRIKVQPRYADSTAEPTIILR